jgi:hypothetical protein
MVERSRGWRQLRRAGMAVLRTLELAERPYVGTDDNPVEVAWPKPAG